MINSCDILSFLYGYKLVESLSMCVYWIHEAQQRIILLQFHLHFLHALNFNSLVRFVD